MNYKARLRSLESRKQDARGRCRVIVSAVAHPANLANSTCTRTLYPDGQLTEFVYLDGSLEDFGEENLEWFIAGFPIQASNGPR